MNAIAPIIFIHYGFSEYLPFTLQSAKINNPGKEVILLGDAKNKHLEKYGIRHVMMEDYLHSPEISLFDKVFKVVGPDGYKIHGKDNGNSSNDDGLFWTKFVFKKMFVFYNFARANQINRFWTFDSDNLILSDLGKLEERFRNYDNTEQNLGNSMHGIINNLETLYGYINMINTLFQDEEYLKLQHENFKNSPKHHAFTEMAAYAEYKRRVPISTFHLKEIIDGTTFDDKLAFSDGMEMISYETRLVANIKKLYIGPDHSFYFKHLETNKFIKTNTIDFSWLPAFVPAIIYKHLITSHWPSETVSGYKEVVFNEPIIYKLKRAYGHYKRSLFS